MDTQEWLTLDEASAILKMHPVTVRRYLRTGDLVGRKLGKEWRIGRSDLEMFLRGVRAPAETDQKPKPEAE